MMMMMKIIIIIIIITHTHTHTYIYICVCVCVCVCDSSDWVLPTTIIRNNAGSGCVRENSVHVQETLNNRISECGPPSWAMACFLLGSIHLALSYYHCITYFYLRLLKLDNIFLFKVIITG